MACENIELFRGAGEAYIATLDAAKNIDSSFRPLGNTPVFTVSTTQEFEEVRETKSGNAQLIGYTTTSLDNEVALEINSFSKKNLEVAFYGTNTDIAAGSVTNEAQIAYAQDEAVVLDHLDVSSVVVTGPSATPTFVLGTDYSEDLKGGTITPIAGGSMVFPQTLEIDYSYGAQSEVETFQNSQQEYAILMIGKNIHTGEAVRVLLPRVVLSASETLDVITDATVTLAMTGRALLDCNDQIMRITQEEN